MLEELESRFTCTLCGVPSRYWTQRCPYCLRDGTLMRDISRSQTVGNRIVRLDTLSAQKITRIDTGIPALTEALNGGLIPGSIGVLYGEPGTGKSTLLFELACSPTVGSSLFVSGEEALAQVTLNLQRLGLVGVKTAQFLYTTSTSELLTAINLSDPSVAIADSAQSFVSDRARGSAGSASQIKRLVNDLTKLAKATSIAVVLVGQVNANGALAGPKKMPHWVDWVIEAREVVIAGQEFVQLATMKNRFGPASTKRRVRTFMVKGPEGIYSVPTADVLKLKKPGHGDPDSDPPAGPVPRPVSGADLTASPATGRVTVPPHVTRGLRLVGGKIAPGRVTKTGLVIIEGGRGQPSEPGTSEPEPGPFAQAPGDPPDLFDTLTAPPQTPPTEGHLEPGEPEEGPSDDPDEAG